MSDERAESESSADEDDLVVRAKWDRAAFSQLYERYYPEVSRYCLRRLPGRPVAEDILSDVFLEIASSLPTFPGRTDTDFRKWLFRIATNAINAHFRQSKRRQELWIEAAQSGRLNPKADSVENEDERDWPTVYQAIMELDERDRTIVMLRFFSNCSYEVIADVVDSTPGAVRTALSRTLARLHTQFNPPVVADPSFGLPPTG